MCLCSWCLTKEKGFGYANISLCIAADTTLLKPSVNNSALLIMVHTGQTQSGLSGGLWHDVLHPAHEMVG